MPIGANYRYVGVLKEIDRGRSHARDKVKVNYIIGLLDRSEIRSGLALKDQRATLEHAATILDRQARPHAAVKRSPRKSLNYWRSIAVSWAIINKVFTTVRLTSIHHLEIGGKFPQIHRNSWWATNQCILWLH